MHFKGRLFFANTVKGDVTPFILLIDQHRMALRESAATAILPRKAYMCAFDQQSAERQSFGGGPIDALAGLHHLALGFQLLGDFRIQIETVRHAGDAIADFAQNVGIDAGLAVAVVAAGDFQPLPTAFQPIGFVRFVPAGGGEIFFKIGPEFRLYRVGWVKAGSSPSL